MSNRKERRRGEPEKEAERQKDPAAIQKGDRKNQRTRTKHTNTIHRKKGELAISWSNALRRMNCTFGKDFVQLILGQVLQYNLFLEGRDGIRS